MAARRAKRPRAAGPTAPKSPQWMLNRIESQVQDAKYVVGGDPGEQPGFALIDASAGVRTNPRFPLIQQYPLLRCSVDLDEVLAWPELQGRFEAIVEDQYTGKGAKLRGDRLIMLAQRAGIMLDQFWNKAPGHTYFIKPQIWYRAHLGGVSKGSSLMQKEVFLNRMFDGLTDEEKSLVQSCPTVAFYDVLAAYGMACALRNTDPRYLAKSCHIYKMGRHDGEYQVKLQKLNPKATKRK